MKKNLNELTTAIEVLGNLVLPKESGISFKVQKKLNEALEMLTDELLDTNESS